LEELSLHILDIVENSVAAKATKVNIEIYRSEKDNLLTIKIRDNGKGIDKELLEQIESPFFYLKKREEGKSRAWYTTFQVFSIAKRRFF